MNHRIAVLIAACSTLAPLARADEGMWLINKPPMDVLEQRHHFKPSPAFLETMQHAAINFGGASGSFVSKRGLVMTNHHVGSDAIADLTTKDRNIMEDGFYAATEAEELKVPNIALHVLMTIEDVTDRVNAAVKADMSAADAGKARRAAIAAIESEAEKKSGLDCNVVTLYNGGRYHLYSSKEFTDVRLVMAPEQRVGNFGGDTLNFEYPRFDLDMCFFRIYENGKPYEPQHYLTFSNEGAKDGDLALVFGHPGRTQRLLTVDDLKFRRDVELPFRLQNLWREEHKLTAFCNRSAENEMEGADLLHGVANGRKARTGMLAGLLDPELMSAKAADEARLRSAIDKNPELKAKTSGAFEAISQVAQARRDWHPRAASITAPRLGALFGYASTLVRLTEELPKPSGERLPEFADAGLSTVYQQLYSEAPVREALETERLAYGLSLLAERLGGDDPVVVALLAGKSPRARAEECIRGTTLRDPAARKKLAEGGAAAVKASTDPLIALARALDPEARILEKRLRDEVESVERQAYAKIAEARFAIDGEKTYPDATGTLRLSFGPIKGYEENGKPVKPFTTFAEMFAMHEQRAGHPDFALPKRWLDARAKINGDTPYNFVCTADIIGGNSGSPVVNTKGEVIGLIFDGNIQSLSGAYQYSEVQSRAVAVDSRGILESLRKVWNAEKLAAELEGK